MRTPKRGRAYPIANAPENLGCAGFQARRPCRRFRGGFLPLLNHVYYIYRRDEEKGVSRKGWQQREGAGARRVEAPFASRGEMRFGAGRGGNPCPAGAGITRKSYKAKWNRGPAPPSQAGKPCLRGRFSFRGKKRARRRLPLAQERRDPYISQTERRHRRRNGAGSGGPLPVRGLFPLLGL